MKKKSSKGKRERKTVEQKGRKRVWIKKHRYSEGGREKQRRMWSNRKRIKQEGMKEIIINCNRPKETVKIP